MGPRGQEPNESTDDAVWQDLVARLEGTPANPAPGNGTPQPEPGPNDDAGPTDRERADAIFRNQPLRRSGPRDHVVPESDDDEGLEPDEGFVPEEPPPLGAGDPLTILAWIGAAGGPITLLLFALFWRDAPLAATLGILALFLAGAGYLVTKLPQHRDIGDDGAEV
ncbi:hypothetical protein E8P82_13760 [Arthrobacter echini]|uniref:DUF308 domain-containing protein n=1 Tax=Arthrobacter echini TaxID=1529066 RepID=A0A4S5E0Q7_9MICC|nr:hypothetical protein [Arthrobacter echini]THJ64842.1 hypothetical protein E8P82_13760 [Arthrobacter echini]